MPRGKIVDFYIALKSFNLWGYETVHKGDLLRAGHPLLKRRPEFFGPATDHIRFDVELATAKPGELR